MAKVVTMKRVPIGDDLLQKLGTDKVLEIMSCPHLEVVVAKTLVVCARCACEWNIYS